MQPQDLSRRLFLQQSTGAAAATWARAIIPGLAAISQAACTAKEEQAPLTILGVEEATEFEAIASRIMPTTDTPGAREAGVIYFFDQSFGTFNAPMLPMLRRGLEALQASVPNGQNFSDLTESEQDELLVANQGEPFFFLIRIMTFAGYFGMSEYGGNKDGIGWALLGMDPHTHAYESPFGYYDAEYLKEHSDA